MFCTVFFTFVGPIETFFERECLEEVDEISVPAVENTLVQRVLNDGSKELRALHVKAGLFSRGIQVQCHMKTVHLHGSCTRVAGVI